MAEKNYAVVVYGADIQAFIAAFRAADELNTTGQKVALVIPDSGRYLGGLITSGGQNYWDTAAPEDIHQGSFADLLHTDNHSSVYMGRGFGVADMSYYLYNSLNAIYQNQIDYYQSYDIVNYTTASSPYRITSITVRKFTKNWQNGTESYSGTTDKLNASIFIDASQEGRLARSVNSVATVGRCDWTANQIALSSDRTAFTSRETQVGKQQAATLMIMLTGITDNDTTPNAALTGMISGDIMDADDKLKVSNGMEWEHYTFGDEKACMAYGGNLTVKYAAYAAPAIKKFNDTYGQPTSTRPGMYIKPLNAARDGYTSNNWWVNTLLIFDVDGRAHEKDKGTAFYPGDMLSESWNADEAWRIVRNLFNNNAQFKEDFLDAIHEFPGFRNATLVEDDPQYGGYRVGDSLYLRETIHMSESNASSKQGTENSNYAVTAYECRNAGASPVSSAADYGNYATRIGLAKYQSDIHPYRIEHIKNGNVYEYGADGYHLIRNDIQDPSNAVYLPFSVMTTHFVSNLMLAGYAINASSYAWGELRVFPNLCTIGDAAGIAAAYAAKNNLTALQVGETPAHIANVQSRLRVYGARLDK